MAQDIFQLQTEPLGYDDIVLQIRKLRLIPKLDLRNRRMLATLKNLRKEKIKKRGNLNQLHT